MKTAMYLAIAVAFGLLVSCSVAPHPMDMTQAIQDARTRHDHEALAKHYENTAKEFRERRRNTRNGLPGTKRLPLPKIRSAPELANGTVLTANKLRA